MLGSKAVDKPPAEPHNVVPGAQHLQTPTIVERNKHTGTFFHGPITVHP